MESNRHTREKDVTVVSSLESILCDGCQIAAVSIALISAGNQPNAYQSLQDTLKDVAIPFSKGKGEETFDSFADRSVSVETTP